MVMGMLKGRFLKGLEDKCMNISAKELNFHHLNEDFKPSAWIITFE